MMRLFKMPLTCFTENEILDSGESVVNSKSAAYIASKHKGKKIRWLIIKGDQVEDLQH